MAEKTIKQHRDRKNPHAAEQFAKQRKETNAARGKQVWVEDTPVELLPDYSLSWGTGHWERASV